MIIRFTADVDGVIVNSVMTTFPIKDFTAELNFGTESGERRLEAVSIERALTDEEKSTFTNTIEEEADGEYRMEISGYQALHDEAINILQTLESLFGLKGVDKIHWDDAKTEYIPETEDEAEEVQTTKIDISRSYPRRAHNWEFDLTEYDWEVVERLKVPLAFYRRGTIRHRNFDYISAFIEYYFVLEGLFAGGDWKKVEDSYVNSDELTAIANITLEQLPDETVNELNEFFEFYSKERTAEGYLRLITTLRHQLHHYFHEDSSGPHKPSPFDAEDYQPVSVALGHTVFLVLLCRVEGIEYSNK